MGGKVLEFDAVTGRLESRFECWKQRGLFSVSLTHRTCCRSQEVQVKATIRLLVCLVMRWLEGSNTGWAGRKGEGCEW